MGLIYTYLLNGSLLEVITSEGSHGHRNEDLIIDEFIHQIKVFKPETILWMVDSQTSLGLDNLMRLCSSLVEFDFINRIAYVPLQIPTNHSVRNYALVKRMLAYTIEAEVFYDELDAREWLEMVPSIN